LLLAQLDLELIAWLEVELVGVGPQLGAKPYSSRSINWSFQRYYPGFGVQGLFVQVSAPPEPQPFVVALGG